MGEDRGELIVILCNRKQSRENRYFAAGQTKSVDLLVLEQCVLPFPLELVHVKIHFTLQGPDFCSLRYATTDLVDPLRIRPVTTWLLLSTSW